MLDLYHGIWEGEPLGPEEYVISADEKTSIQARRRLAPGSPPAPGCRRKVEAEYERMGALAYLAAWDVRRARLFGACTPPTGIDHFRTLVSIVMTEEPYRSARYDHRQRLFPSRRRLRAPAPLKASTCRYSDACHVNRGFPIIL